MIARIGKIRRFGWFGAVSLLSLLALSACTTFKPPEISYDSNIPPLPDLPALAEEKDRPPHIPPGWTPTRGGKKAWGKIRSR